MVAASQVRWVVFYTLLLALPILFILCILSNRDLLTDVKDVTRTWKTKPIVSVYVVAYGYCADGYDSVSIENRVPFVSEGPCGCVENAFGSQSSITSCGSRSGVLNTCMSLNELPKVESKVWRENIICIKRDGPPAATNGVSYKPRLHPNNKGFCPSGYKRCGAGLNQQEGAVCFPLFTQCPITNLLVLPSIQALPANESWDSAGTFLNNNHTLYVRREYFKELPVVDISFRLTEHDSKGENVRGGCYKGDNQVINTPLVADANQLWSYSIDLPAPCAVTDPRFVLIDEVPLQNHFLQNLQLTEPACAGFELYPLSDLRYQQARDPDYLNSGVKCDFTSQYTCVRDPYQRTNCAAGDDICDGVMNQNICGAYAHAVRSAFPEKSNIALGMYMQREVQWADSCDSNKENVYTIYECAEIYFWFTYAFLVLFWAYNWAVFRSGKAEIRYICDGNVCFMLISLMSIRRSLTKEIDWVYSALEWNQHCTDLFTRNTLMDRLQATNAIWVYEWVLMGIVALICLDAIINVVHNAPLQHTLCQ